MAFAATVVGPLLLVLSLFASHAARRWVEAVHADSPEASLSIGHRNTVAYEVRHASALTMMVVLPLTFTAAVFIIGEFTANWAMLAPAAAAGVWAITALPTMTLQTHPNVILIRILTLVLALGSILTGQATTGLVGSTLALVLGGAFASLLRWDDELADGAGITRPPPDSWIAAIEASGIPRESVRVHVSMERLLVTPTQRVVFPAGVVDSITPHQAVALTRFTKTLAATHHRWWHRVDIVAPAMVVTGALAPTPGWVLIAISVILIGLMALGTLSRSRIQNDIAERLSRTARDPIEAASFAHALHVLDDFAGIPPALGSKGLTSQDITERLGVARPATVAPPRPWPLAAKMTTLSLIAGMAPLLLAQPMSWALGPQAQAVVAVGTGLGSDVTPARREATILINYGEDIDTPDVAPYAQRQLREIGRLVGDRALHDEAVALYVELADGCEIRPELHFFIDEPDETGRLCARRG